MLLEMNFLHILHFLVHFLFRNVTGLTLESPHSFVEENPKLCFLFKLVINGNNLVMGKYY